MNFCVLKNLYVSLIPFPIRKFLGNSHWKEKFFIPYYKKHNTKLAKIIAQKKQIKVAFLAMDVSFWKYESLFFLMQKSSRYIPLTILAPRPDLESSLKEKTIKKMKEYFLSKQIHFSDTIKDFKPDIIFYTQPYKSSVTDEFSFYNNPNSLFCYVPYTFLMSNYEWIYNQFFHNIAWMLFYPTQIHLQNAKKLATNRGENVYITGYPLSDSFALSSVDPWPKNNKKRIIWAAHVSVIPNKYTDCSTFLIYAQTILKLAKKYESQIEFAFKPHPILKHNLYLHPDWGKEKTDAFFDAWANGSNTMLFESDYVGLFKHSHALIHDCGSFTVEYLYTKKPCLFIGTPRDSILCDFGKKALDVHYKIEECDIESFIIKIIEDKNDTKANERNEFYNQFLLPPNKNTVAQNIIDAIGAKLDNA